MMISDTLHELGVEIPHPQPDVAGRSRLATEADQRGAGLSRHGYDARSTSEPKQPIHLDDDGTVAKI